MVTFIQKKEDSVVMLMESQVEYSSPQNISGASQQNSTATF